LAFADTRKEGQSCRCRCMSLSLTTPSNLNLCTYSKSLYTDSPIDSGLFSLYIHQNYTQFCNELEECDGVIDWLSWVDSSGGEMASVHRPIFLILDLWIQWYEASPHRFHLLTLGTLHSLPSPVPRRSQKIFKPDYFDYITKEKDTWDAVSDTHSWMRVDRSLGLVDSLISVGFFVSSFAGMLDNLYVYLL